MLVPPGAPARKRKPEEQHPEESSSSDDTLWANDAVVPGRARLNRQSAFRQGAPRPRWGAWKLHSSSMPNLRTQQPVRPSPTRAAPLPTVTPAGAPAAPASRQVLILDSSVSNSVAASLALDAFVFMIAWAPFSFYGALFFVIAQRMTFFLVERHTRQAVIQE